MEIDWQQAFAAGAGGFSVWAGLKALGGFAQWLVNWKGQRQDSRDLDLREREKVLADREREYDDRIQKQITGLQAQVNDLDTKHRRLLRKFSLVRGSLLEVTIELRIHSPESSALAKAESHLLETYSEYESEPDKDIPKDMAKLIHELDQGG